MSAECGTYAGYLGHKRRWEPQCEECRRANRDYYHAYRAANPDSVQRTTRAANRAKQRLVELHRDEYERLYAEALADVRAEMEATP